MEQEKQTKKQKQDESPKEFKGDGIKTTSITSLKDKIKNAMKDLKDLASMEIKLPVQVRMKKRLESIKKMSSAESIKIDGHWKTIAPKMHIRGLTGRKISPNECEIRFCVYESDEKNNKKLKEHYTEVTLHDGSKIKRVKSAEYVVAYEVIETIKHRKPIEREIVRFQSNN